MIGPEMSFSANAFLLQLRIGRFYLSLPNKVIDLFYDLNMASFFAKLGPCGTSRYILHLPTFTNT